MRSQTCLVYLFALVFALGASTLASAATVTNVILEQFEDAVLHPLLTQNGTPAPVYSNGFVDLDGANGNGVAPGFFFDITPYTGADGGAGPEGGGPSVSFIMEARIGPTGVAGSDGMGAAPSSNDVLLGFNGRYGLRFATATDWSLFKRASVDAADINVGIPNAADRPTAGSHIAIVFTNSGATDTLAYYKDGVLAHSVTGDFNRFNVNRGSFGLEVNTGASLSRGFNGTFDAIAFSTFTGTFNPAAGDRFALTIPEPSSAMLGLAGFAVVGVRWSGRIAA